MRRNGFNVLPNPILQPLETIECRDAILAPDGAEPAWPEADVIVGNPPFLGNRRIRKELGDYVADTLPKLYNDMVHGKPDLVCYWFAKAGKLMAEGTVQRAGLVATNSIRGGTNRNVLDRIVVLGSIFDAWSDEPWVIDGAAVRVSLVCFGSRDAVSPVLPRRRGCATDQLGFDRGSTRSHGCSPVDAKCWCRLSGRYQARFVRHIGRTCPGVAEPSGESERKAQRRCSQALDERHGPHPPSSR